MDFFDKTGMPVCYAPDKRTLFLWTGEPVGLIHGDLISACDGRFLGWFDQGWIFDRNNAPALFTGGAAGGPLRPQRLARVEKSPRKAVAPVPGARFVPIRPAKQQTWSAHMGVAFFDQMKASEGPLPIAG